MWNFWGVTCKQNTVFLEVAPCAQSLLSSLMVFFHAMTIFITTWAAGADIQHSTSSCIRCIQILSLSCITAASVLLDSQSNISFAADANLQGYFESTCPPFFFAAASCESRDHPVSPHCCLIYHFWANAPISLGASWEPRFFSLREDINACSSAAWV